MYNVQITIAYDGTRYAGWQVQKNVKTIQGKIEKVLRKILGEKIRVIGSGRTDSGVHASAQTANFKTKKNIPLYKLRDALNVNLPKDISITEIKKVPLKFHSQFDAKSKVYRYAILNDHADDPFTRLYCHKIPYALNVNRMKKEAVILTGKHDFKSFQAKSDLSPIKDTVRAIKKIKITKAKKFIYIDIEADGFLHNMARNIAGTLIDVGRGRLGEGSIEKILKSRDRRKAGPTAPAKGLILLEVKY